MIDVALVYPYFYSQAKDRSIFKFPPLGLGYLASSLKSSDMEVEILDGTFQQPRTVFDRIKKLRPKVLGFYVMVTMEYSALELVKVMGDYCEITVVGGPYPSAAPELFLPSFDLVSIAEGEESLTELIRALHQGANPVDVAGFAHCSNGEVEYSPPRARINSLDKIPFPARSLFDNEAYIRYWQKNYGYNTTSMITTRGCPFKCGFCSKPVFGDEYRERSATNVVNEIEDILRYGYDSIWVADDCFTLNKERVVQICKEIIDRGLKVKWECLSRVDNVDKDILNLMREAGCTRIFFGLESGNDEILRQMKKGTKVADGQKAVVLTNQAGVKTGGFFILGYPGETNKTILNTVNYSSSLPLDYLSYTVPYPLPGTDLFETVKDRMNNLHWTSPRRHRLLYRSDFSEFKIKFAMAKGLFQHWLRLGWGKLGLLVEPIFRKTTDIVFRILK